MYLKVSISTSNRENLFLSSWEHPGLGKSTLLNILGILDNYDTGDYYLNNVLIKNLSETKAAEYRNRMIGFIFQSFNLISFKDAVENVALPLFYQGNKPQEAKCACLGISRPPGFKRLGTSHAQ